MGMKSVIGVVGAWYGFSILVWCGLFSLVCVWVDADYGVSVVSGGSGIVYSVVKVNLSAADALLASVW